MGNVPLPVLKELEHQARQNFSTVNFMAAFTKTSSSCNFGEVLTQFEVFFQKG